MADDRKSDEERTTIVTTDGDGGGSAGIVLAALAILILLLAVLFFAGVFDRSDESELNVTVNSPDVNVIVPEQFPPLTVPEVQPLPDVNVNVTTPPPELPEDNLSNTGNAVTNSR